MELFAARRGMPQSRQNESRPVRCFENGYCAIRDSSALIFNKIPTLKVKSMSRKEAMQKLRQQLVDRRAAIRAALKGDLTALGRSSLDSGDAADIAMDSERVELTSALIEAESHELANITDALARLECDGFGDCEDCGQKIPLARLRLLPYARFCIGCQEKFEKTPASAWSMPLVDA